MLPSNLLTGTLLAATTPWPLRLFAVLGDLRTRFLAKGKVGAGYRFIARNGRVLLATRAALTELADQIVEVRLQVWHRAILTGDEPEPYGVLLCIRNAAVDGSVPLYRAELSAAPVVPCALVIDVGGGRWLEFVQLGGNEIRAATV